MEAIVVRICDNDRPLAHEATTDIDGICIQVVENRDWRANGRWKFAGEK